METFWYIAVAVMLAGYVVLDGFDFGVGMLYPFVARSESERRDALASIGPVWNGNEVWLLAGGGLLFFAFPRAYAAGFSGFYLALIMVLWLLIARGLALEIRSHLDHELWRKFWDWAFAGASLLLAIIFGAALGNLIRGVPLTRDGYFFVALWTDFALGPKPGILDWYTGLMGLTSAALLALHGGNYLTVKTDGPVRERAARAAWLAGWTAVGLAALAVLVLPVVQPILRANYDAHPAGYAFPLGGSLALAGAMVLRRLHRDAQAFAASSLCILSFLGSVAWGMYPHILIATTDPAGSLTVFNATSGDYGLQAGLWWFVPGFGLVMAYSVIVHRAFRGKVRVG
jgi:cytochrome d ubiquinol oxidase subunit II